VLVDAGRPVGGSWNFDRDNRLPPPRKQPTLGLPPPWMPEEDDIDAQVRRDIAALEGRGIRFVGDAAPREFAVTRAEALAALDDFVTHRLPLFGPYEDAAMTEDPFLAHSRLSVPLNLGLLHPSELVAAALSAFEAGHAPLQSVEGFIRQVIGWREYVWHLHWHLGEDYSASNALGATRPLPDWWANLEVEDVRAHCLRTALAELRVRGWNHHIQRLMIFGNWALQRGFEPSATADWFRRMYVDGYEWVMSANVIGMALYADGGVMATKPYAAGGAYIHRMTNYCGSCTYRHATRVGASACPFTAGYWSFIDGNREQLKGNHRMSVPLRGLERLVDLDELLQQERARDDGPP
jgi:deoxyribodipyrimidine photolyase-related protein